MMTKWADYCVTSVKYNSDKSHIEKVKVRKDLGDDLDEETVMSRHEVVNHINNGMKFITITKSGGKWNKGADINIVTVSTDYIKTAADKKTSDNLENLPEF